MALLCVSGLSRAFYTAASRLAAKEGHGIRPFLGMEKSICKYRIEYRTKIRDKIAWWYKLRTHGSDTASHVWIQTRRRQKSKVRLTPEGADGGFPKGKLEDVATSLEGTCQY
ncbi:hypothetical protein CC79DRAFT_5833 [Sarocladium strictum]